MISESKYERDGFRVWRKAETNTKYLSFEVFPTKADPAGIYVEAGKVTIPSYPRRSPEEAEHAAKAILLAVQAAREISTGIKTTCLDEEPNGTLPTWEVLAESGVVIGTVNAVNRRSAAARMRRMFHIGHSVRFAEEQ